MLYPLNPYALVIAMMRRHSLPVMYDLLERNILSPTKILYENQAGK